MRGHVPSDSQCEGHVRRRLVWVRVQRWISRLRRTLSQQFRNRVVRFELHPLLAARQRDGHMRWRVVRMGVRRGLPQLRRKLCEQHQHGDMRFELHSLLAVHQRDGHV